METKNTDEITKQYEEVIRNLDKNMQKRCQTVTERISPSKNTDFSPTAITTLARKQSPPAVYRNIQTSARRRNQSNSRSFDCTAVKDPNIYFRTTQNVGFKKPNYVRSNTSSLVSRNRKMRRYQKTADSLITKCKQAETYFHSPIKTVLDDKTKQENDKRSTNMGWALKEFIADISGKDWDESKNINFLLGHKDAKKVAKRALLGDDLVDIIRKNMVKRSLLIACFGKRKIWKPTRYIPSKKVVLANSIEELNNLYKIC